MPITSATKRPEHVLADVQRVGGLLQLRDGESLEIHARPFGEKSRLQVAFAKGTVVAPCAEDGRAPATASRRTLEIRSSLSGPIGSSDAFSIFRIVGMRWILMVPSAWKGHRQRSRSEPQSYRMVPGG